MTIDRKTLELAAKAAGLLPYDSQPDAPRALVVRKDNLTFIWSPLIDHGQLLDLAMARNISIVPSTNSVHYFVGLWRRIEVNCQDFPALAEAVIQAAAEQQMAKDGK